MRVKGSIAFYLALLSTLAGPVLLPKVPLYYCAPYLVISFYRQTRFQALWRALGCGVLIDLLSSSTLFGLTSLNYCLVTLLLYGQKRNFFEDKLSTLPLMAFLFSSLSTLLFLAFTLFFGRNFPFSWLWAVTDLAAMPLIDALYALLVFSFPFELIYRIRKPYRS